MSPFARTIILVAALLGLLMTTMAQSPVVVGDDTIICVEGYVMDQYCINNVVMIDNGIKTLEQPDKHSVHCLVDVGVCVDSLFEILGDPTNAGEMYTRGFQVDEGADGGAGKERLLDVARTVGNKPGGCSTCYGDGPQDKGFRAVMNATVLEWPSESSNTPAVIQVHTVFASNDQTSTEAGSTNVQDPCQEMFGMMQTVLGVAAEPPVDPTDENNGNNGGGDGSGAAAMTSLSQSSWKHFAAVLTVAVYAAGI